jgi:FHA domain-containing protein
MAGPLAAVERFFERLFERPAARLFQARVEPIQIERGLERAMEAELTVHSRRSYAPSEYRVLLNVADLEALDGDRAALGTRLSETLRGYARGHGYVFLARPRIDIQPSPVVQQGDIRVFAEAPVVPAPPAGNGQPSPVVASQVIPADPLSDGEELVDMGPESVSQVTQIFAAPQTNTPRAVLAVRSPGQSASRLAVRPGTIRVGRSMDNDVVLADERVSRHHGQLGVRLGMLVYTDLGSTNGSYLNGSPVSEIALGPGDVLQLGSSTITIEPGS